jgi:hypothetical protein
LLRVNIKFGLYPHGNFLRGENAMAPCSTWCGGAATVELTERPHWHAGIARCDSLDHICRAREDERMKKLALILLFACGACTSQAHDPQTSQPAPASAAVSAAPASAGKSLDDIRRLIGTPSCSDSSQCRSLPVGALACGGPQEYLPWSTVRTNEGELQGVAERFKVERQAEIKRSGEMSICIHRPDPGAVCVSGACQLGGASPAV